MILELRWRPALVMLSVAIVIAGCGRAQPSALATSSAVSRPSAVASVVPAPSAEPSGGVEGSASPTVAPSEIAATPVVGSSQSEPPIASIAVEGGDPVAGELGSYTWLGAGSDSPWLDGRPIHVGAGERLTLTIAEPVGIARWTASRVPPGNRDGFGAIGMGEGSSSPAAFEAPPRGTWSVGVTLWFSGNRGSAAYYWLATVR